MSSYSYKVTRETTGPRGGSYTTSSYSSPTTYSPWEFVGDFDPVSTFYLTHTDFGSHMVLEERDLVRARNFYAPYTWQEGRSYHSSYMTPSRTSRYVPPPRTTTYTSYVPSSSLPRGEDAEDDEPRGPSYLRTIPSVAHQRLTSVSMPAYSSPLMPYLLMEPDDIVVLPRRRTYRRLADELEDDPVLKWYEDRIHHAEAEAIANANKRVNDLCTPRPRHISVVPPYTPKRYREPITSQYNFKYRPPVTEDMKPIKRNIEMKSRFDKAHSAAQNDYRRMGSGHLACVSLLGGPVVSKRRHSRFYSGERARSEVDMAARLLPPPREDPGHSHRRSSDADPPPGEPKEDLKADVEAAPAQLAQLRLLPISGVPGAFRMVATGERPVRKAISEEPELTGRATRYARDAATEDPAANSGDWTGSQKPVWEEETDQEHYYDFSPESDYELTPDREYEAELIPELEPSWGGAFEHERETEPTPYQDTSEPDMTGQVDIQHEQEIKLSSDPEREQDTENGGDSDEPYVESELDEAYLAGEPDKTYHELEPEENYQEPEVNEETVAKPEPEAEAMICEDADEDRNREMEPLPGENHPIGGSDSAEDICLSHHDQPDVCNAVDQVVITTSLEDEPKSDASDGSRAKLTQMKSEAAQRLDDLEKLIDEHQEIVEELKRTESSQGSLVDLADKSRSPSPLPGSDAAGETEEEAPADPEDRQEPENAAPEQDVDPASGNECSPSPERE